MTYTDIRSTALGGADYQTTGSTTLNGGITNSDLTITVTSTASFKSGQGILLIDSELITYTGTTGTTFTGCVRGTNGTTAASHLTAATVTEKEIVKSDEVNATFDAAASYIKQLSNFWRNSYLYTVYDDFTGYSLGTMATNTNWTVAASSTGTGGSVTNSCDVVASSLAGGTSGRELLLYADVNGSGVIRTSTIQVTSKLLADNKHKHCVMLIAPLAGNSNDTFQVTITATIYFGSQTLEVFSQTLKDNASTYIPTGTYGQAIIDVIALGSGNYDVYVNGYKRFSNVTEADPQLSFKAYSAELSTARTGGMKIYIADFFESASEID